MVSGHHPSGKRTLAHRPRAMSRRYPPDAGLKQAGFRRWLIAHLFYVSRETLRIARASLDVSRETLWAILALLALLIVVPDSPRNRARVEAQLRARGLDRPTRRPD